VSNAECGHTVIPFQVLQVSVSYYTVNKREKNNDSMYYLIDFNSHSLNSIQDSVKGKVGIIIYDALCIPVKIR